MFQEFKVMKTRCETALSRSGLPGLDYALNPYVGCSHACIYCYARLYTRNRDVGSNWGRIILVKENIVDVLRREVAKYPRGVVGIGTVTDAYQPVEAVYKLTRRSLEVLLRHGFHVSIQTKNPLVLRDMDLLVTHRDLVDVGFTITTLDYRASIQIEPHAPPPNARLKALEKLVEENIASWIFYGPIIPGINSDPDTVRSMVDIAKKLNIVLYYDVLHVKSFMNTPTHPLYNYIEKTRRERRRIMELIETECRRQKVTCRTGFSEG
ncbi:SPL family radical SAM protein [Desulfurococcus amylolyticus]|uniref:Radical SAM domain protein n=1 Tax=Desulfurococcus amylolyticus DSM 16532 TaxID=768672 RepID=I3XQR2_DESAM|nr:Radical SAM domain protein [Desulfurococcus amylolyticus DSM 16532]